MAWATYRKGRRLTVALPPEVKSQMIKIKARGGGGLGEQIVEALRRQWSWGQANSAAVTNQSVPPPPRPQPVVPGAVVMHNGRPYRLQPVNRPGDSRIPEWRL